MSSTLLDIRGKMKDNNKARLDLPNMGFHSELHLVQHNNRWVKPSIAYVLSPQERRAFCVFLKSGRFPDGFAVDVSKNVIAEQGCIYELKSHECHVML